MKGKTKIKTGHVVSVFIVLLLIAQFGFILYLNNTVESLGQELNSIKNELEGKIQESSEESQEQISKLTADVIKSQESIEDEISQLKASTSADFSGIIEQAVKSVVSIQTDISQASGFIITEQGYIVTNTHVLEGATEVQVLTYEGELINVEVIGHSPSSEMDIVLLKIPGNYDYLEFANSDNAKVGEKVIAVGNPYGLSFTVTEGIISALNRVGLNNFEGYLQTDVPLNPGNSGGPLINADGEVVGINNFKVSDSEGLGFALESNHAKDVINRISNEKLGKEIL